MSERRWQGWLEVPIEGKKRSKGSGALGSAPTVGPSAARLSSGAYAVR